MSIFTEKISRILGIFEAKPGRTFKDLQQTYLPLQNGWTETEVVDAMEPDIMYFARSIARINPGVEVDDMMQQGALAVLRALQTDAGKSNFASYAKNFIRSFMRAGKTGFTGTSASVKDPAISGVSIDKPIGGEGEAMTLGGTLAGETPDIIDVLANKELLSKIIDKANLTPIERKVIELSFGLGEDESVEEPVTEAEEMTQKPGKKVRGPVVQKKGKFARKVGRGGTEARGSKEVADILGISKQAVNAARNRAFLKLFKAASEIAPAEFEEPPYLESFIRYVRHKIVESIVDGSINGVILG